MQVLGASLGFMQHTGLIAYWDYFRKFWFFLILFGIRSWRCCYLPDSLLQAFTCVPGSCLGVQLGIFCSSRWAPRVLVLSRMWRANLFLLLCASPSRPWRFALEVLEERHILGWKLAEKDLEWWEKRFSLVLPGLKETWFFISSLMYIFVVTGYREVGASLQRLFPDSRTSLRMPSTCAVFLGIPCHPQERVGKASSIWVSYL